MLAVWDTVAQHDPRTADRILDRIEEGVRRLGTYPQLGSGRPDIAAAARMLVIERWLVLYRIVADGVQIVRVVDGARDLTRLAWPIDE